jgi:hypothetical protein
MRARGVMSGITPPLPPIISLIFVDSIDDREDPYRLRRLCAGRPES